MRKHSEVHFHDGWWWLISWLHKRPAVSYLAACRDMFCCGSLRCILFRSRTMETFSSSFFDLGLCGRRGSFQSAAEKNWANEKLMSVRDLLADDECWSLSREKKAHVHFIIVVLDTEVTRGNVLRLFSTLLRYSLGILQFPFFLATHWTSSLNFFLPFSLLTPKKISNN